MTTAILIVDDERDFLDSMERMLRLEGYRQITTFSDPLAAAEWVKTAAVDVALLDITMPEMDGVALLSHIKQECPQTECIMITANEAIQTVVECIKKGAYDYLLKPLSPDQLRCSLDRALEHKRLIEAVRLRSTGAGPRAPVNREAFAEMLTESPEMLLLLRETELHAASDIPILITGETGSGKELLARAIHRASNRANGPFVAVNMLALSPGLFESEFFGHARGAFTGADRDKRGYLSQARGGTLFLDEIGDLALEIQGKLLRILQEGEFVPVGKTKSERANVRFVAATNQDLDARVAEGRFRKDLFYRLQFAHMHLAPLCERIDDVPLLARHFVSARSAQISEEALAALCSHSWPGNVRELKGTIDAAVNLADGGTVQIEHLRIKWAPSERPATPSAVPVPMDQGWVSLERAERDYIFRVLEHTDGRITGAGGAAEILDLKPSTLNFRIQKLGLRDALNQVRRT